MTVLHDHEERKPHRLRPARAATTERNLLQREPFTAVERALDALEHDCRELRRCASLITQRPSDDLLAFPFDPALERAAARKLLADHSTELGAVRIGRKTYVRRSRFLALIDRMASEQASKANRKASRAEEPDAAYFRLVEGGCK